MITIKKIEINRNWSYRNGREYYEVFYNVPVSERYDLVKFIVKELGLDIFWHTSIGVPLNTSEQEINKYVYKYAETITNQDVKDYRRFIDDGDKYGWD